MSTVSLNPRDLSANASRPVSSSAIDAPARPRWWRLDPIGSVFGFAFAMLAVTPSLLPRPAVMQGALAAVAFGAGYVLGAAIWLAVRSLTRRRPSPRTATVLWRLLALLCLAGVVVLTERSTAWQSEVRRLVEMPPVPGADVVAFAAAFVPVTILLLALGRAVRRMFLGLRRIVGVPIALGGTIIVVLAGIIAVVVLALIAVDAIYLARNGAPDPDAVRPASAFRSAGAGSEVDWDELGRHGSVFVSGGPTARQISALTGVAAKEPIRVYAGLESADSLRERAELVVDELHRTGAFDRSVIVVATTTGSGWLEPQAVDAIEYLMAGDTAIASMQYAYTPSWVSSMTSPELPVDAARTLFEAIADEVAKQPGGERPRLLVYGLSLGAFGTQGAFDGLGDLRARTDGALLVGSPNGAEMWRSLQSARDAASPIWRPVLDDGREVRWISRAGDEDLLPGPWEDPRVLYLQHATDPVTWLSADLLWSSPEWLEPGQRGPDVSSAMRWIPVVTALQVTVDMLGGEAVPARHGHTFGDVVVTGWREVVGDAGLSTSALGAVQAEIESYARIAPFEE